MKARLKFASGAAVDGKLDVMGCLKHWFWWEFNRSVTEQNFIETAAIDTGQAFPTREAALADFARFGEITETDQ